MPTDESLQRHLTDRPPILSVTRKGETISSLFPLFLLLSTSVYTFFPLRLSCLHFYWSAHVSLCLPVYPVCNSLDPQTSMLFSLFCLKVSFSTHPSLCLPIFRPYLHFAWSIIFFFLFPFILYFLAPYLSVRNLLAPPRSRLFCTHVYSELTLSTLAGSTESLCHCHEVSETGILPFKVLFSFSCLMAMPWPHEPNLLLLSTDS